MDEYYGKNRTKKPPKSRKNNMSEREFKNEPENEVCKRKTPKRKKAEIPLHPHERKKAIEAKMAKNNSAKILAKKFDFDPQEYLDKSLLFDLKKTSEEQIFEAVLEKICGDHKYYIEHRNRMDSFQITHNEKQRGKDNIIRS